MVTQKVLFVKGGRIWTDEVKAWKIAPHILPPNKFVTDEAIHELEKVLRAVR